MYAFVLANTLLVGFCKFANTCTLHWNDNFLIVITNNTELKALFFYLWDKALECPSLLVAEWRVPAETSACCDPGHTSLHVGIQGNICYWGGSPHQSTLPEGHKHNGNFMKGQV